MRKRLTAGAEFEGFVGVTAPAWLVGWEDSSWGNDLAPSAEFPLEDTDDTDVVRVWVNFPDRPELRDIFQEAYCVQLLRKGMLDDDTQTLYEGSDEAACMEAAAAALESRRVAVPAALRPTR